MADRFERQEKLKERTKAFAVRVLKLFKALPRSPEAQVVGKQLLRSATSVAANYRALCRARSVKEFASRLSVVVEEADESLFWMEMLIEGDIVTKAKLQKLLLESAELVALFSASLKTTRNRLNSERKNN